MPYIQIYDFNAVNLTNVLVTDRRSLLVGVVLKSSILESGYLYFDLVHLQHGIIIWSVKDRWMGVACSDSWDMVLSSLILAERFLSFNVRFYWNVLEKP